MKRKFIAGWLAVVLGASGASALANDWSQWRGPEQNGVSREVGLPESWDPDKGDNVAWKNDKVTGMSSPIVMNGKLYTWTRTGEVAYGEGEHRTIVVGPKTRETLVCVDAGTGKI